MGREPLGLRARELEVLGRERLRKLERLIEVANLEQPRHGLRFGTVVDPLSRAARTAAESEIAITSVPGPCSACASRSSASGSGSAVAIGDHDEVARSGEAVDADLAEHLALGLLHVQVARPDDHVHAVDRFGAVRQRRHRLRAADPVDRVGTGEPAGAEHDRMNVAIAAGRSAHGDPLRPRPPAP